MRCTRGSMHGLATALRPQRRLDGGEDLVVGEREALDVHAIEIRDVDRAHLLQLDMRVANELRPARRVFIDHVRELLRRVADRRCALRVQHVAHRG